MHIFILTLFPDMFAGPFSHSMVKRAQQKGKIAIEFINIRDFAADGYGTVDDHPYGGGHGMIMKVDVLDRALTHVLTRINTTEKTRIILTDPKGTPYTQGVAGRLTQYDNLIIICGHYEGLDARVSQLVDEAISLGDFIVTGGELPAMVIVDSVTRLLPGVLPKTEAAIDETFTDGNLEYPQYTRPEVYKNMSVPPVLVSGNHKKITEWRKQQTGKVK